MKLTGKIAQDGIQSVSDSYELPGHHKVPRIWILLADHHLVRVFRKVKGALELIGEAEPTSAEEHSRNGAFAKDVASWLDKAVEEDVFDRVVLIAPPKMLGEMRADLSDRVQNRIVAEVHKDLTKMGQKDLEAELGKIVWF